MLPPLCKETTNGKIINEVITIIDGNPVKTVTLENCYVGCETCETSSENCTSCKPGSNRN